MIIARVGAVPTYADQREWADRFIPEAQRVITTVLSRIVDVQVAPEHEDNLRATDLLIDNVRNWGFRVRRPDCPFRDFTVRAVINSGRRTELAKIMAGHGDQYLYAWTSEASDANRRFSEWAVIDLDSFRDRYDVLAPLAKRERNHGAKDSDFDAWSIGALAENEVKMQTKMTQPSLFAR